MLKKHDIVTVIKEARSLYSIPVEAQLKIVHIEHANSKVNRIFVRHVKKTGPWGTFEVIPSSLKRFAKE